MTEVKPGQTYADNDPRSAGRTIRVEAIDGDKAVCSVQTNTDDTQAYLDDPASKPIWMAGSYGDRRGKTTRISLARFVPNSTGYRLISEG